MQTTDNERAELEIQLQTDLATLRTIVPGLDALEARWVDATSRSGARQRGYFTPEEDDRVRQMVLAYRNYRVALHEIIFRCWPYPTLRWPDLQLRMFLIGFATGLTLYAKSLKLIRAYEHQPLYRDKINEADSKFELEEGFFEKVLCAYSSLWNYRGIAMGTWFWLRHRRAIESARRTDPEAQWLVDVILRERGITRQTLWEILLSRLRYDWRLFIATALKPVQKTQYNIKSIIGNAGAKLRTTGHYRPALRPSTIANLQGMLQPGDILLIRAEKKLTSAILPGFWAHAALYVGNQKSLGALGLSDDKYAAKNWTTLAARDKGAGCVIEAISPAVQIVPLSHTLFADHVLVLRPRVNQDHLLASLSEAFGHVGKPYDFEFDFNVSTRIVCTELIYRCFHKRGRIEFPLIKRLGRFTLTGDDVAKVVIDSMLKNGPEDQPFEIVALVLSNAEGRAEFLNTDNALSILRKIQEGWRPTNIPEPANA